MSTGVGDSLELVPVSWVPCVSGRHRDHESWGEPVQGSTEVQRPSSGCLHALGSPLQEYEFPGPSLG